MARFVALQNLAAKQTNITPINASDSDTNLPALSCDSIYMRLVYHHFTKPNAIDSNLHKSLKYGGRLAIIDEEPMKGTTIPDGVRRNRLGTGIPEKVLIGELKHAGFKVQTIEKDSPGGDAAHPIYCVVFLKR